MDYIADIILGLGAFGAGIYCLILSRRLKRFNNLQDGMGGAVAVLSAQVDDMTKSLNQAQSAAGHSASVLTELTERAEVSARKLELMMASLHDLPDPSFSAPESVPDPTTDEVGFTSSRHANSPLFLSNRIVEAAE
ncbi:hypothetical protein [Aliiroseovarius sp. F20344]|uniref:hypothetical protein n=1 Tax=Aliiroseovarius sp. F20344 TaxID=2926414 RepID=UPI001FF2D187|nr:hypothetical protein [Aliiroseovarius sp. F20344]MCK0141753.1 hypothetical protein [Aliiroseovarius sp. F20344]